MASVPLPHKAFAELRLCASYSAFYFVLAADQQLTDKWWGAKLHPPCLLAGSYKASISGLWRQLDTLNYKP